MPVNCECLEKLSFCCPCKLNVTGYVCGWLGIVGRTVLVALLSSTLSNITNDDPSLYSIVLITCLTYVLASFIINLVFLFGIFAKKRYQLLPYITIVALEMALGVIISSGIIMLCFAINAITAGIYLLCISVLIIGVHFVLWLFSILLYKDMQYEAKLRNGKINNIALTRMDSLDTY